jgi:hypothetical protein
MVKLILLVPAIVLLALGSEGLFYAARGRHDVVISCDEFARARPSSIRVRVIGCEPDYAHAAYRESESTIEELFLPVRSAGQNTEPASIVVATSDPAAVAIAQRVLASGATNDQSLATMKRVAEYLGVSIAVDGVVRAGVIERLRSRRILSRLSDAVASDAVVIDLRATPNIWRPALAFAAGLAMALVVWLLMRRSSAARATSTAVPAATPSPAIASSVIVEPPIAEPAVIDAVALAENHVPEASEPSVKPAPASEAAPAVEAVSPTPVDEPRITVMLPKLLLLNVDVLSGPEAVESAPPLGTRNDVGAILCGVIPDLEFVDGTRVLGRYDGSIKLDIGAQDTVATVVVEVHGQAGVALIKELLLMTGWRAFAPKTGLFVSADDLESLAALAGSWKQDSPS